MKELWSAFGWVLPIMIIVTVTLIFAISFWKKRRGKGRWLNLLPVLFTCISIGGICLITLTPLENVSEGSVNFDPFSNLKLNLLYRNHLDVPIRNLLANIILFIPFTFFLAWWMRQSKQLILMVTFLGGIFSFGIELAQYYLPLGRATDIDDWMMNTMGSFIGGILFVIARYTYTLLKINKKIK
ncbi:VanZ family protein [Rossellomorea vietnamensis]|uniref:VanZ family protein n=1 Tax=Rossellomorea vietnamensis TaxID=218284 RepID=UPI001CCD09F3|nr:VanZ family protein [Rossellomorea vietnamensis]MCA0148465.1 VanZ family protein [Rossellomorea vietnamensis]